MPYCVHRMQDSRAFFQLLKQNRKQQASGAPGIFVVLFFEKLQIAIYPIHGPLGIWKVLEAFHAYKPPLICKQTNKSTLNGNDCLERYAGLQVVLYCASPSTNAIAYEQHGPLFCLSSALSKTLSLYPYLCAYMQCFLPEAMGRVGCTRGLS